jgi:TolA-binding protein
VRAETRHSLKEDRFRGATIEATERAVHWTVEHKSKLIIAGIVLLALVAAGFGSWYYLGQQDEEASLELSKAVRTMETQVRPEGVPAQPDFPSFASSRERATEARKQFQAIVDKYPHTKSADIALYFVGLSSSQVGDNAAAERDLRKVVSSGGQDLSALAKFALASVYRNTNRLKEAIDLYKQLIDKPAPTVGKAMAQMELAETYVQNQQPGEAKVIYQQIQKENPSSEVAGTASKKVADLK